MVILSLAIAAYDFIFTGRLPVTADMFAKLDNLPFAPAIAWRSGELWPAIGLGDTLMSAAFVLALRKAFGGGAAAVGSAAMALTFPALFLLPLLSTVFVTSVYPAMVLIGPVQWLVHLYCRRRYGVERTTREYRQAASS